jgi:hypothetical protein
MINFIKSNFYSIGITIIAFVLIFTNASNLCIIEKQETSIKNLNRYVNHLNQIYELSIDYANRLKEDIYFENRTNRKLNLEDAFRHKK